MSHGVWPLYGRARELSSIDTALRGSGSRGVMLIGPAGVGKTRLAREALRIAVDGGRTARWVACSGSSREIPWGAFASILPEIDDPTRMLQHAITTLQAEPDSLLFVDDAHLLDEMSAVLVFELVTHSDVTVVLTVRSGEIVPAAVSSIWKEGQLEQVDVSALSEGQARALLETVLGGPLEASSAERLWTLTEGNPLFLYELVVGELQIGRIARERNVWRWLKEEDALPRRLADLIGMRMGEISDEAGRVVDALALAEPLDLELLGSLVEPAALDEAEQRGLIRLAEEPSRVEARLAHPLYGEARRLVMGPIRARRIRGAIATAMRDAGPPSGEGELKRALLALDSDLPPDPVLFTAAAHRALAFNDLSLAERLSRAAIDAGAGYEARLTHAYALSWLTRGVDAEGQLLEVESLARTPEEQSQASLIRAANLFWTTEQVDDAVAVIDRRLAESPKRRDRAEFLAIRSAFIALLGKPAEAIQIADRAPRDRPLSALSAMFAAWGSTLAHAVLGEPSAMEDAARLGYAMAAPSADVVAMLLGLSQFHILGLRLAGRVEGIGEIVSQRQEEVGSGLSRTLALVVAGIAALATSRLGDSERDLREALDKLPPTSANGWRFHALLTLTQATAQRGDSVRARAVVTELDANLHRAFRVFDPEVALAHAWVAASEGSVTEAVGRARRAAELAAADGSAAFEVLALQTAACFGDGLVAGRLAKLALQVEGPRAPAAAAHAAALAAADPEKLLDSSRRYEAFGDILAAADAAAQASHLFQRSGLARQPRPAAAKAEALAKRCQGARTPALAAALQPLPLTSREREIATMAARGMSNRAIADRLVLSERTVEGHLYRASGKLGVANRSALAELLVGSTI